MSFNFVQISEDSRCPDANPNGHTVACYWSGQITADIQVTQDNGRTRQNVKLTLPASANAKVTSKATVGNYTLEVLQFLPRAVLDVDIQPGDYYITLAVTK